MESILLTSAFAQLHFPFILVISTATFSRSFPVLAINPTATPSAARASAMARPIPFPAPVTMAVLFFKDSIFVVFDECLCAKVLLQRSFIQSVFDQQLLIY